MLKETGSTYYYYSFKFDVKVIYFSQSADAHRLWVTIECKEIHVRYFWVIGLTNRYKNMFCVFDACLSIISSKGSVVEEDNLDCNGC